MAYLLVVSAIWAASFSLIQGQLGGLEASGVSAARLGISLLFFLPFLRLKGLARGPALRFAAVGALQYGLMYLLYIRAYGYLQAHEIALFTILTPVWVTAFEDVLRRRFTLVFWVAALVAVAGTAVVRYQDVGRAGLWTGFFLIQLSNACFALGQVLYRRLRERYPGPADRHLFALLYAGAVAVSLPVAAFSWDGSFLAVTPQQVAVLVFLGVVSSGLCFFWWNVGATRVDAGTLAVMNNLKVPLGVAVALVAFGVPTDLPRLAAGGGLVLLALVGARLWDRRAARTPAVRAGVDRSAAGTP